MLILKDLQTNNEQEFNISKNGNIEHNNKNYNLKELLSEKSHSELQVAIKQNEPTSFMPSKKELNKMQERNLINNKLIDNDIVPSDATLSKEDNQINTLKKELAAAQEDNKKLKQSNNKLVGKLNSVEQYFKQDKGAFKEFNKFLSNYNLR